MTTSTPREPVLVWIDEDAGQLMSELGPVDNALFRARAQRATVSIGISV